jgi:hypothetical protein
VQVVWCQDFQWLPLSLCTDSMMYMAYTFKFCCSLISYSD